MDDGAVDDRRPHAQVWGSGEGRQVGHSVDRHQLSAPKLANNSTDPVTHNQFRRRAKNLGR